MSSQASRSLQAISYRPSPSRPAFIAAATSPFRFGGFGFWVPIKERRSTPRSLFFEQQFEGSRSGTGTVLLTNIRGRSAHPDMATLAAYDIKAPEQGPRFTCRTPHRRCGKRCPLVTRIPQYKPRQLDRFARKSKRGRSALPACVFCANYRAASSMAIAIKMADANADATIASCAGR